MKKWFTSQELAVIGSKRRGNGPTPGSLSSGSCQWAFGSHWNFTLNDTKQSFCESRLYIVTPSGYFDSKPSLALI